MLSHRRDPYLWLYLASLAIVPLCLDVCLAGLAVGEPAVAPWFELMALVAIGLLPVLWMQLQHPFYVFSVPALALRPDQLAEQRRRLLTLQRGWLSRGLVVLAAIALGSALYWLYQIAPLATDVPWLTGKSRATGWSICAIAFLGANFFTLVAVTVIPLLLTSPRRLEQVSPIEAADILQQFTVLGLRVGKILPEALPKAAQVEAAAVTDSLTHGVEPDPLVIEPVAIAQPEQSEQLLVPNSADAVAVSHAINTVTDLAPDDVETEAESASFSESAVPETPLDLAQPPQDLVADPDRRAAAAVTLLAEDFPDQGSEVSSQVQELVPAIAVSESPTNLDVPGAVAPDDECSEVSVLPVVPGEALQCNETAASHSDAVMKTRESEPISSHSVETANHEEFTGLSEPSKAAHQARPLEPSSSIHSSDELVVEVPEGNTSKSSRGT